MPDTPPAHGPSDAHPALFRIVRSQFPFGAFFGHDLIALLDPANRLLREADGLATSRSGRIKPIGYLPSDRLKVHEFDRAALYRPTQPRVTLFEGTHAEAMQRWAALREAGRMLNALDLPYPFLGLGPNSNSVACTLTAAMALDDRLRCGRRHAPGRGTLLLQPAQLADLHQRHGWPSSKAV
ncbi:hypothetical protein CEK29_07175 [Bordetella genomosp. 5]|uniref:hypothetical protein n=1 Tax=Bordetella genomosp. 5 TaxID=1395608 RepID=UPI000B9E6DF1|nr:hypothetical protein [Bordetella genomosp. 5]OZI44503.1 hypothetical protein CEK29_07175 [Bordetella genomosp. 5]